MCISAVVFDYGGVICNLPSPENTAQLERLTGLPASIIRELNRKFLGDWDRGLCNGVDFYRRMLAGKNIFPDDKTLLKIAETDMNGWKQINPDSIRLLLDIKAAGFRLGILSNMPFDFLDWVRENIVIFDQIDTAVFSCEEKTIKPESAIYEILREKLNCTFAQIVFFDDLMDNVSKAQELGIIGCQWNGPQEAEKFLKSLGGGFTAL